MATINVHNIDLALTHNWSLDVPIVTLLRPLLPSIINVDLLNLMCTSTDIPVAKTVLSEYYLQGKKHYQATGIEVNSPITLTFLENETYTVYRFWDLWKNLGMEIVSNNQTSKKVYKALQGFIISALNSERTLPVKLWELFGVYPSEVNLKPLDSDPSIQMVEVLLNFEMVRGL